MTAAELQRVAAIAAKARADADGMSRAQDDGNGDPAQPTRNTWTVHRWGDVALEVTVYGPQTQREMRALYPEAAGIIPRES